MGTYFPDLPARTLSQMGDVKDNPVHLVAEEIYAKWPVAFLWGKNSGTSGEHPKGLALDFSVLAYGGGVNNPGPANMAMGDAIAAYLWQHRKRLGVWYIIWNRRIISMTYESSGWRPYTGRSPHTDHVHGSFYSAPVYSPPSEPLPKPEDDMPTAKEIVDELLARQVELTDGEQERYDYPESISVRSLLVHAGGGTRQIVKALAGPEEPPELTYTVQPGDTLTSIAARHGVDVDALADANHISDPNRIFPGQVLTIPRTE